MVSKHNKRVHNGKDRHTGRKIPKRSEQDKKVNTRSVGSGRGFVPITLQRRPSTVRCNCTGDEMDKVNERLFRTLQKFTPEGTWNGLTGSWERKVGSIPPQFARKYRIHMHHFRPFFRDRMDGGSGVTPHTRR